jgi:glycerol-3-phosphate dehydrogenase
VVNVAGPWIDDVLGSLDPRPKQEISGTKGSHIFLPATGCEPTDAIYAEAASDGRPFFIVPWNGLTMIGTTDLPFSGNLDDVTASDEEIDYLLAEARRLLPLSDDLTRTNVLFTYSGVRPLPAVPASSPGGITRRHFLVDHSPDRTGLYSVIGGKLTTHRSLAEHVVDEVAHELDKHAPCRTRDLPFPYSPGTGMEDLREELMRRYGLSGSFATRLTSIYGSRSREIAALAASDAGLAGPLADGAPAIGAELVWSIENEMALGLSDAVIRRAVAAWTADLGRSAAEAAARIGQSHLGWTKDRAADELAEFDSYIERFRV